MPVKGRPSLTQDWFCWNYQHSIFPRVGVLYLSGTRSPFLQLPLHLHYGFCAWRNLSESSHPPTDQQCSLSPQNSHSKELPGHSSVCLLAESGISRVFASQLERLWWLLCSVENKMLCYCVRGRLCACHHFVLDLISSRSNPVPSCHFISYKCTSPATTTTKKTRHQNLMFLFHHWVCGLPFPFCSLHVRMLADFSCVSVRHCAAS